jgi:hypothetical protein
MLFDLDNSIGTGCWGIDGSTIGSSSLPLRIDNFQVLSGESIHY